MTKWLSAFFLLLILSNANAQSEAFIQSDSNYAETGNPFVVHLSVPNSVGKPNQIDFSAWENPVPEQNILKQTQWTLDGPSSVKDLTLVFFNADTLTLPPLPIRLNGGNTVFTNALEIIVLPTPSPDDLNDMADIKDIRREPAFWTDYLPWAVAIAGLVLLVLLASWLIGRAQKKRKQAALSRTVELPPHEMAWKKLDALGQKQLWNKGLVKEYCAEITFIVREYLERRYQIPALESTTEELPSHLQKTDFPEKFRTELQEFLSKADLVKFAKAIPPEIFREEAMSLARKLISETRVVENQANTSDNQAPQVANYKS